VVKAVGKAVGQGTYANQHERNQAGDYLAYLPDKSERIDCPHSPLGYCEKKLAERVSTPFRKIAALP
jgi:hypothetical protein